MELREALLRRRSIRAYRPDPVPDARLEDLIALANWAPSAENLQSRAFVVVRDEATRAALARLALGQAFVAEAPAVVVFCGDPERIEREYGARGRDLYTVQDAAAATENYLLAAHAAKLATVWVSGFEEDAVRRLLRLPPRVRPLALVPTGRPAERPKPPARRPLADLVHWDRW